MKFDTQSVVRRKIFLIDGSISVTGAFISARDMARVLRANTDVVLFLPRHSKISVSNLSDFSEVHYLPISPLRRSFSSIIKYIPNLVRSTWMLHRITRCYPDGFLLVNDFYLIQGHLLRVLGHHRSIITWLRINPKTFREAGKIWLWFTARFSDHVVAVSEYVRGFLPQQVSSHLLYDPVSAEFLLPSTNAGFDSLVFVFLGNYIPGKGQDVALESFARLLVYFPSARLKFYGSDMGLSGNKLYLKSLINRAAELDISEAVSFGGFVEDVRVKLVGAFAALNLSRSEAFSRTVLEACAAGLPVIATRCGGPAEILIDGVTGLMVPVDDVEACVMAMRTLCSEPSRASKMGCAAREHVMKNFSPQSFSKNLLRLLE